MGIAGCPSRVSRVTNLLCKSFFLQGQLADFVIVAGAKLELDRISDRCQRESLWCVCCLQVTVEAEDFTAGGEWNSLQEFRRRSQSEEKESLEWGEAWFC